MYKDTEIFALLNLVTELNISTVTYLEPFQIKSVYSYPKIKNQTSDFLYQVEIFFSFSTKIKYFNCILKFLMKKAMDTKC